jgi:RNA polymerase sigma-70 factor (ECF subfamily)
MDYTDTTQLVTCCRLGNEIAVERLVNYYKDGVFRLALSVLDDAAEASEATQDAFIAALGALETYRDGSSFKSWLYTIALNTSRSRLRKRKTLAALSNTLQAIFRVQSQKDPSPEDILIQNEQDAQVWEALNQLGEKHRLPMILRYYHELSMAEIAEILRINEGTVRSRIHTAQEKLRGILGNEA